jgi:hypothetical protein
MVAVPDFTPESVLDESLEQVKCKVDAGMPQVVHIIEAINVFDIKVVAVAPAGWPSCIKSEPIAAVLEAVIPTYQLGTHHVERVVMTEIGAVMVVRNAAIVVAVVAAVGSNCPWLLLRRLCAPRLLFRLLCALRLLLRRLCALWLLLRLLCALRLRLRLLCLLWLLLRLLCFFSASALFLLSFLCECRNGGSEKKKQNCCADDFI